LSLSRSWIVVAVAVVGSVVVMEGDVAAKGHSPPAETRIVIHNGDPPGWGLDDKRPFTPVGGNDARTLGEARMNAVKHAARIWSGVVVSATPIVLDVTFNHEACGSPGVANGGYTPVTGFAGAKPGISYPPALANTIAKTDVNGSEVEGSIQVVAVFDEDPGCHGLRFYYGLDHPKSPKVDGDQGMDFVEVIEHEIGHVLGFNDQHTHGTIAPLMQLAYDETQQRFWPDLSPAERKRAAKDVHNLTFNAPATNRVAASFPSATTNGHMRLGAGTKTLSHWESHKGLLMAGRGRSPYLDVTPCALEDIGWKLTSATRCPDVAP
jgi:hypothetical protein